MTRCQLCNNGIVRVFHGRTYQGSWVIVDVETRTGRGKRRVVLARGKETMVTHVPEKQIPVARRALAAARERADFLALQALAREPSNSAGRTP